MKTEEHTCTYVRNIAPAFSYFINMTGLPTALV